MENMARPSETMELVDPVCGMKVGSSSEYSRRHEGKNFFFCSSSCLQKFSADPARYLVDGDRHGDDKCHHDRVASASTGASDAVHICPMCPEVSQIGPGPCPKCGMALEPETPSLPTKVQYTCPMHPEIIRDQPGNCPKCGMALEPMTVTVEEEGNPELIDMTRRFTVKF